MNMKQLMCFTMILIVAPMLVAGCASLDTGKKNQSVGAKLAKVDKTFTQTVRTINDLHDQGTISQDQMQDIAEYVNKGDKALDVAWEAYKAGNKETALEKLDAVKGVIDELKPFLEDEK